MTMKKHTPRNSRTFHIPSGPMSAATLHYHQAPGPISVSTSSLLASTATLASVSTIETSWRCCGIFVKSSAGDTFKETHNISIQLDLNSPKLRISKVYQQKCLQFYMSQNHGFLPLFIVDNFGALRHLIPRFGGHFFRRWTRWTWELLGSHFG